MTFSDDRPTMIEFKDVHKYYGDYHALRGINGTIKAGEFFSLLGPSGCGKTTLLRTIAGFEGIDSGAVLIDGKDMANVAANVRPTNMVFQSYAIFPHMSVEENVGFGLRKDPRSKEEKAKAVAEEAESVIRAWASKVVCIPATGILLMLRRFSGFSNSEASRAAIS